MTLVKRNGNFPFIFDELLSRNPYNWGLTDYSKTNTTVPAVNIKETPENFAVEVAAPGMNKKDFSIKVDGNVLTIRSEKTTEKEDQQGTQYTTREFSYQSFERSFTLPKDIVDIEKIEAKYEDGVLYLQIPKKEKEKAKEPRMIEIA
ncbi:MAG: Hsp20/alpha crystallin family protein [Cytophaga sp.]|uniref:Hsp20/alpha crystallin family protein n=1 Tax=Cytophaga sp. TaxID=29535 RepID=UPI003F7CDBFC